MVLNCFYIFDIVFKWLCGRNSCVLINDGYYSLNIIK